MEIIILGASNLVGSHRIAGVGRDQSNPLPRQSHPEQETQECPGGFGMFPGMEAP